MAQQGLPKPPLHDEQWSYQWREWLRRLYIRAAEVGQILWAQVSKVGSNLTDIETRNHNDLQNMQGGTTAEYYHLTQTQRDTLTNGSNADALHIHDSIIADDLLLTPDDALVTDGDHNAMTPF